MPNARYIAGRRCEYLLKKELEQWGYTVLRTAGSHGPFDLIVMDESELFHHPVRLIQIKSCKKESDKNATLRNWKAPLRPNPHYAQEIICRWDGKWWGVPPIHRHEHKEAAR